MKLNSRWKASIAALVAVGTVFGASAVSDVANALPPGTPPFQPGGGVTLTPGSGTSATPFNFSFNPVNQACPGDNTQGWAFSPYLTADDPAQLVFSAAGSPTSALGGRTTALRDTGGNLVRAVFPNLVDGLLIPVPDISFAQTFATTPLAPGVYNVGIACFNASAQVGPPALVARENARYWNTQIVVEAATGAGSANFIWGDEDVAGAPEISTPNANAAVPTINYSFPPAISAVTELIATVTPTNPAGPALPVISVPITSQAFPATTGSFTVPGLTLGTEYSVSIEAENAVGSSPVSNTVTLTPSQIVGGPVVTPVSGFPDAAIAVNWTATPNATSYDVVITDSAAATVFSAPGELGTTVTVPANTLAVGSYTIRVTPNMPAGFTSDPAFGEGTLTVTPNTLLYQEITVERPAGALILTQRCGVYGGLPAFGTNPATTTVPGFPRVLSAEGTLGETAGLPGNAPGVVATGLLDDAQGQFDRYPNPVDPKYPTQCGVDMDVAELVTEGDLAGRFYTAHGRMNQVTVLDTTDEDRGWFANGDLAGDFITGSPLSPTDSFDGNYLGWEPVLTRFTTSPAYPRTITVGAAVAPGQNSPDAPGPIGMKDSPLLASTIAGQGQGVVDMDARLALLIPASADAGIYTARLDLTVVSR